MLAFNNNFVNGGLQRNSDPQDLKKQMNLKPLKLGSSS